MAGMKVLKFLIPIVFLSYCSSSDIKTEHSYVGYFSYFADAANFTDCSSDKRYPVAMEGEYINLEKAYLELDKNPGEKILVEIVGHIDQRKKMEGEGKAEFLVVKRVLKILPDEKCK
jgi:copper homeostasis protein (lipoprotein)